MIRAGRPVTDAAKPNPPDAYEALKTAIRCVGGLTALAKVLDLSPQAIFQWKRAPAKWVIKIEEATDGAVSRHILRPDIYPPMRRPRG